MQAGAASPDQRRHHTVPVCYLRAWQDRPGKNGKIVIERLKNHQVVQRTKIKPKNVLWKRGFYDLSDVPLPIGLVEPSLLERGALGEAMEPAYSRTRSETIDRGTIPTVNQAAFLAEVCLGLYWRSPRFKRMADAFCQKEQNEQHRKILQHHATRTLGLMFLGPTEILKNCVFQFIEATGKERFWTSDTPSWMWHRNGSQWQPTSDLIQKAARGETATRWLCPLSPKYLLQICPTVEQGQRVHHSAVGDADTRSYNGIVLQVAEEIRVAPN